MNVKNRRWLILFLYFIFISILFFLPGSAFPKTNWLSKIWFDKWVHIGLFALLIFLMCWAFEINNKRSFLTVLAIAAVYGISVELIQDQFVLNRSFDWGDWLADITGSLLGVFVWKQRHKKK
jgi:VanZ family protein